MKRYPHAVGPALTALALGLTLLPPRRGPPAPPSREDQQLSAAFQTG